MGVGKRFADRYFGYDDAIYASCRLLEILSHTEKPLSELLSDVPASVITPEIRVPCPDEIKFNVIEILKEELKKTFPLTHVDGIRVKFKDGWGLVRASNTEPVLDLRFEASTENNLREIRKLIEGKVESALSKSKSEASS